MSTAYEREVSWPEKVRAALFVLLEFVEHEPAVTKLVFVESLAAGPKVLEHRVSVLDEVKSIFEVGDCEIKTIDSAEVNERSPLAAGGKVDQEASERSPLTGEGAVDAVWGILHTRIVQQSPFTSHPLLEDGRPAHLPAHPPAHPPARHSLIELVNPLTAMIALPYIGYAAAARELHRPALQRDRSSAATATNGAGPHGSPRASATAGELGGPPGRATCALEGLPMRVTYRTLRVLTVIAEYPREGHNPSNREIADGAGISDQAQISRLLRRLEKLGLVDNLGRGHTQGQPNAWRLTAWGSEVQRALEASSDG